MSKDWVCDVCGYSNADETTAFCGRCGNRRHFIRLNYKKLKVSPGSALYATSTTADNAAAISDSINLFKELERSEYDVQRYAPWLHVFEEALQQVRAVEQNLEETVKQGKEAQIRALAKAQEREERAAYILKRMAQANHLFKDRRGAELFNLGDKEILLRLRKASSDEDDFVGKIASLASLFDVELDPLRRLVPDYNSDWRSIKLVEKIFEKEKMKFDPDMIKIWRNIIDLRNSTPIHPEHVPISTLEFFGVKYPPDCQLLWDNILDKFRYSLDKFVKILFDLPKK